MVTKKMIQEKIADLTEEQLNQVYDLIEQLSPSENLVEKPTLMSELQKISIEDHEYFSVQIAINLGRDVSED